MGRNGDAGNERSILPGPIGALWWLAIVYVAKCRRQFHQHVE